ncbi:MAG: DUF308 domain-containing protein [Bacteroidetes bacterium]|nr:DUF308 domain-containing protein [Bacteroidota bacterium]
MTSLLSSIQHGIKHWYIPMIIGILFIALGIYIYTVPLETYVTLSILFSLSFIFSGIFEIVFSISNNKSLQGWGWYLTGGILSFILGIYLIMYPAISITGLPFVVGFTMLFRSMQGLGVAFDLKSYGVLSWGNLALVSALGIILSFVLLANPIFTGISIVVMTAMVFIVSGIYGIIFSLQIKKLKDLPNNIGANLKEKINSLTTELKESVKKQSSYNNTG